MSVQKLTVRKFDIYKSYLSPDAQIAMVKELRAVTAKAPLFSPTTRWGKKMSVAMTSAGKYGWYSDTRGYRYEHLHPNGTPWPEIPPSVLGVWFDLVDPSRAPDCCLLNYYSQGARMGLHQDRDEADFSWPVLSISLGDAGLFRIGSQERGGATQSLWLESGDVSVMGGAARLTYHGIDRIKFGSSGLLQHGGRINLTLRVVD